MEVVQQRSGAFARLQRVLVVGSAQALLHRLRWVPVAHDLMLSAIAYKSLNRARLSRG